MSEKGVTMTLTGKKCFQIDTVENNETITVAFCEDGLYWIQAKIVASPRPLRMVKASTYIDMDAWHRRLANTYKQKVE